MSLLLARSQLCLLLLIDSCCYNYLVFKNEWSTANQERAVQSKEKKSPYLLHSFWSPSKIRDITYGTGISDSLKAVSFLLSEVWQPWKQKRKKVVNSLPLEMPSIWLANIFVAMGSDAASVDDVYFQGWSPHAFMNPLQFWLPAQWFLQSVCDHRGTYSFHWSITTIRQGLVTQQWAALKLLDYY